MSQARGADPTSTIQPVDAPLTCFTMSPTVAGSTVSVAVVTASLSGIAAYATLVDPDQQIGAALPMVLLFLTAVGVCVVAGSTVRWLADNPGAVTDARRGTGPGVTPATPVRAVGPTAPARAATPQARPAAVPSTTTAVRPSVMAMPTEPIATRSPATSGAAQPVVLAPRPATVVPIRHEPEAAPVEAAPVEAAPVEAAPVEAAPVEAAPEDTIPDESTPDDSGDVQRDDGGPDDPRGVARGGVVRPRRGPGPDKKGKDARAPKRVAGRPAP